MQFRIRTTPGMTTIFMDFMAMKCPGNKPTNSCPITTHTGRSLPMGPPCIPMDILGYVGTTRHYL